MIETEVARIATLQVTPEAFPITHRVALGGVNRIGYKVIRGINVELILTGEAMAGVGIGAESAPLVCAV